MRLGFRVNGSQRFFPMKGGKALIGSSSRCDIVIDDESISAEHVRVRVGKVGIEVNDLGSTSGSFVNGYRIDKHFLSPSDELRLGEVSLEVVLSTNPARKAVSLCTRCGAEMDLNRTRKFRKSQLLNADVGPLCQTCEQRTTSGRLPKISLIDANTPEPPVRGAGRPRESKKVELLAGYELLGVLGEGSQGIVYRMRRASDGLLVAVKRLGPEHGRKARARFEREAEALARLQHPNIVEFVESQVVEGATVIVMGFVEGPSLLDLIKGGPLPPPRALNLARQVAEGLAYAASKGIVHRDVKPSNVLVGPDDQAKLTDFGLACFHEEVDGTRLTVEGQWLGTPYYMAPEQCEGKQADGRTDVYGLGATFFQAITGSLPFTGHSPADLFRRILMDRPDMDRMQAVLGEPGVKLFERFLAREVEDRPTLAEVPALIDAVTEQLAAS